MASTDGLPQTNAEGTTHTATETERRNQVMVGDLPQDFLRAGPQRTQVEEDERVAQILQAQQQAGYGMGMPATNFAGRFSISVVQAKLAKNYGITKMDPYCRIRVGLTVFESPTVYNGSKNPVWNKTVTTYLPVGVDSMFVEIFDERSFLSDDRIAWSHIKIPEGVMNGETVDDWFLLTGRQGDDKEGMINLVLALTPPVETNVYTYNTAYPPAVPVMMPGFYPGQIPSMQMQPQPPYPAQQPYPVAQQPYPVAQQPYPVAQQPNQPMYTEEDVQQVKDMFPNMEEEAIKSVLEANRGNKDATINALLAMSAE